MKKIFFLLSCFLFSNLFAQNNSFQCYPTNWWTGMKWNHVQIMIHGKGIGNATDYTINYPGVTLKKSHRVDNINYEFLDIVIAPSAKPGIVQIHAKQKDSSFFIHFSFIFRFVIHFLFDSFVHSFDSVYIFAWVLLFIAVYDLSLFHYVFNIFPKHFRSIVKFQF